LDKKQFASEGLFAKISLKYNAGNENHIPGTTSVFDAGKKSWREWIVLQGNYEHYFGEKLKWGYSLDAALT
jgi:hypothetical protein